MLCLGLVYEILIAVGQYRNMCIQALYLHSSKLQRENIFAPNGAKTRAAKHGKMCKINLLHFCLSQKKYCMDFVVLV